MFEDTLPDTVTVILLVTDERACSNSDTVHIFLRPTPEIGPYMANDPQGLPDENYCVADSSYFADTLNTQGTYFWDFGDDDTAHHASPVHAYRRSDKFNVTVQYTDIFGCKTKAYLFPEVQALPRPAFLVADTLCLNRLTDFKNTTSLQTDPVSGSINQYTWSLGNGDTVWVDQDDADSDSTLYFESDPITNTGGFPGPDLSYDYHTPGNYTVTLRAKAGYNCFADTSMAITVSDSVHAAFDTNSCTNVCAGELSGFVPAPEASQTNVFEYRWLMEDTVLITTDANDTAWHRFSSAGIKETRMVVISSQGCTDTATQYVSVAPAPTAHFTAVPVCEHYSMTFKNLSSQTNDPVYHWNLADTSFTTTPSDVARYTFDTKGKHTVSLNVVNKYGCSAEFTDTVFVGAQPEASFETRNICMDRQSQDTTVINTSQNPANTYYKYTRSTGIDCGSAPPVGYEYAVYIYYYPRSSAQSASSAFQPRTSNFSWQKAKGKKQLAI